jgi:predicted NBD/HSP70 family sugar kinase
MIYWDTDILSSLSGQEKKKFLGKKMIINHLHHQGCLSGSDLSGLLQLSTPTTMLYVNELISEGYVEDRGKGDSLGGRRPSIYGLNNKSIYIFGIDIARKQLSISLYNIELTKVASYEEVSDGIQNDPSLIDHIYGHCMRLCSEAFIDPEKIFGIGLSLPGLINSETGFSYTYLSFGNEPITHLFQKKFRRPVFIENDAKTRTLAEVRFGSGKNVKNMLFIQIDWGLGLGMVLNGELYRGKSGFAGELSHIPLESDGVLCQCGKIGCLETVASANALVRLTLEQLENNRQSLLYGQFSRNPSLLTAPLIINAAIRGDQLAVRQVQRVGENLGKGIAYLIQILNPELIVIGGVMTLASEYLLTAIRQSLFTYCFPQLREDTRLALSSLGDEAGVLGAAAVAVENLLTTKL